MSSINHDECFDCQKKVQTASTTTIKDAHYMINGKLFCNFCYIQRFMQGRFLIKTLDSVGMLQNTYYPTFYKNNEHYPNYVETFGCK